MEELKTPENPTLEYFPQMLQTSKVLVIDHNITRFHTYDVFSLMLLDPMYQDILHSQCPTEIIDFLKTVTSNDDPMAGVKWAYENFTPEFLKKVFVNRETYLGIMKRYLSDERIHCTPTTATYGLENIFGNNHICGAVLRQIGDKRPTESSDFINTGTFKTFLTDNILDVGTLTKFINKNGFNAVLTDSVQMAATMAYETKGVTYIIGTYRFNFDDKGRFMGTEHLTLSELSNKNEFAVFYPYNIKTHKEDNDENS